MTLKSKIIIDISHKKIFDFLISLIFVLNNKSFKPTCSLASRISNITSGKPQYEHLHLIFSTPVSVFSNKTNQSQQQINFNDLTVFFDFSLKKSITLLPFNVFENNNLYTNLFKNIFIFWALKF
jgi:hypothetical protein